MNDTDEKEDHDQAAEYAEKKSGKVDIKPSESDSGDENNAPGRTPGKAEGSTEIVKQDLRASESDKR